MVRTIIFSVGGCIVTNCRADRIDPQLNNSEVNAITLLLLLDTLESSRGRRSGWKVMEQPRAE